MGFLTDSQCESGGGLGASKISNLQEVRCGLRNFGIATTEPPKQNLLSALLGTADVVPFGYRP